MNLKDKGYILMTVTLGIGIIDSLINFATGNMATGMCSLAVSFFVAVVIIISLLLDINRLLLKRRE